MRPVRRAHFEDDLKHACRAHFINQRVEEHAAQAAPLAPASTAIVSSRPAGATARQSEALHVLRLWPGRDQGDAAGA